MSWVALASFASFGIYTLIFFLLAMTGHRSALGRALAILITPYAIWAFGNTFLLTSQTPQDAFFWDSIASFGWATFGPAMLNFSLVFTKTRIFKSQLFNSLIKIIFFVTLPAIVVAAQWSGLISTPTKMMWYGYGANIEKTLPLILFFTYYIPYVIIALVLILRYFKREKGYKRKQAFVILLAYIIPFTLSVLTDNLAPAIGLTWIPPLAMILSLMLVGGILFAITRYNMLFSINPTRALLHSLSHSKTSWESILNSSPHITLITGRKGVIQHINNNARIRFDRESSMLQETKIESLFENEQLTLFRQQLSLVEEKIITSEEKYILHANNNYTFPATVTISPLTNCADHYDGFIITIVDITTHEKAEQTLLHAKHKAEEADRAKSEFLANISHELHTPIDTIIATTETIKQNNPNTKTVEQLTMISSSSSYLQTLLNDLLDIARIESGKFETFPKLVEIRPFIENITKIFPSTPHIHFSLVIAERLPQEILIDPLRLQQILVNLLSNAFKFTEKGEISLTLDLLESTLTITVSDSGIGISQEDQQTIFDKFSQGRQKQNIAVKGTGIGLAIVKELARLMCGSLSVESELKKGSTFVVSLSIAETCDE